MTKILAIDDNNDNLITLRAIIKESFPDLDFETALSGKKGIELAISTNPDVIFLDIIMPDMDGFEVCRRLKQEERTHDIPVVFLTALKENKENRIKALEVGGEAFLYKPIDETELVAQIRAMVKIKEFAIQKRTENERLSRVVAERTRELVQSHAETLELVNKLKAENETRRKIEYELRESEEKYRLLYEYAGVGIGYYTPDGTVISYNKVAALNMNGKPEDFVGKSIYSLFPKDDADFYMDRIKKALNSETGQQYEDRIELPKEVRWFQSVFTRILDSRNKVSGVQIISTDITERKESEIALNISESRLKRAELASGSGNWEFHLDSKTVITSEGAARIYGIEMDKFEMQYIKDIPLPEFRQTLDLALKNLIEENQPYQVEFKIRKVDTGEIRDIQSEAYFDQEKRIAFGIIQDITERVKRDEALSNINDLLSKFILHSPIYTFIKEVTPNESRVLKASENFIDMIGIPGSEMIGKNMHELFPPEFADKITADDWEVASNDHLIHLDEELNGKFYITIKYPIKQGNKTLLAGYTIDITERKNAENALRESEERFRTLANSGQALIWTSGLDKKCNYFNQPWLDFTGRTIEQELGDGWVEGVHPDDLHHCVETYMTAFDRQEKFSMEYRVQHVNGDYRWIQDDGSPRFDSKGEFIGFIGHCLDITERKQAEATLKENEVRLHELIATKDKFFSIISHDLKNPFNSILGLSNLLVEQIQEKNFDRIEEYAAIIQKSSIQVFDLLVNLLEWSRLQTGRIEFSPEYVEMVSLINEVTELFGDSVRQKSITIFKELPRNMLIFADKAMISTILRNLISNAIKFTHPQGQIVISAESKKDKVIIAISDNGMGIKNENIEKLFRIAENQTTLGTKNERGTGLGLILCKEFIEKHGGKIRVESEVGKGSKFYFTILKT